MQRVITVADNVLGPEKMSFSGLLFPYVKEFVVLLNFFVFKYVSFKRSTEPSALRSVVFMGALGNACLLQQIPSPLIFPAVTTQHPRLLVFCKAEQQNESFQLQRSRKRYWI